MIEIFNQQQIYDQNLQDQNSKIRECEKLTFLRNIYDENERAAYVDNVILKSDRSMRKIKHFSPLE
jgi:hypothetical protein